MKCGKESITFTFSQPSLQLLLFPHESYMTMSFLRTRHQAQIQSNTPPMTTQDLLEIPLFSLHSQTLFTPSLTKNGIKHSYLGSIPCSVQEMFCTRQNKAFLRNDSKDG